MFTWLVLAAVSKRFVLIQSLFDTILPPTITKIQKEFDIANMLTEFNLKYDTQSLKTITSSCSKRATE